MIVLHTIDLCFRRLVTGIISLRSAGSTFAAQSTRNFHAIGGLAHRVQEFIT
jgi:hypothetical protein